MSLVKTRIVAYGAPLFGVGIVSAMTTFSQEALLGYLIGFLASCITFVALASYYFGGDKNERI